MLLQKQLLAFIGAWQQPVTIKHLETSAKQAMNEGP